MRKTIESIAFVILHGLFLLPQIAIANGKKDPEIALALTISGSPRVCLGRPLVLTAKLKNVGRKSVLIDPKGFWRYFTEISFDQSSASSSIVNFPIRVPRMRGTRRELFFDEASPSRLLLLKPNKTFSVPYTVQASSDEFYKVPGRYAIRLLYADISKKTKVPAAPVPESVAAPEFRFEIAQCKRPS